MGSGAAAGGWSAVYGEAREIKIKETGVLLQIQDMWITVLTLFFLLSPVQPHITLLKNVTAVEGSAAMISCVAEGEPLPDISWRRAGDGRTFVDGDRVRRWFAFRDDWGSEEVVWKLKGWWFESRFILVRCWVLQQDTEPWAAPFGAASK